MERAWQEVAQKSTGPAGIPIDLTVRCVRDTLVKSAYQLQPLKTLRGRWNSLPDCDCRREALRISVIWQVGNAVPMAAALSPNPGDSAPELAPQDERLNPFVGRIVAGSGYYRRS
jgi:hypothetical protein